MLAVETFHSGNVYTVNDNIVPPISLEGVWVLVDVCPLGLSRVVSRRFDCGQYMLPTDGFDSNVFWG
jgi:hypothetical protein